MPRRAITSDICEGLMRSFREAPGLCNKAGRSVGVCARTAMKAWEWGLPTAPSGWRRPMKEVLAEEQEYIRAAAGRAKEDAARRGAEAERLRSQEQAERAREDATASRQQELQIVRMAKGGAMQLLATLTQANAGAMKLGARIREECERLAALGQLSPLEMGKVMGMLSTLTSAQRMANDASSKALEMERLIAGQPQHIIGVAVAALTPDEARRRAEQLTRFAGYIDAEAPKAIADGGNARPETQAMPNDANTAGTLPLPISAPLTPATGNARPETQAMANDTSTAGASAPETIPAPGVLAGAIPVRRTA